MEPVLIARSQPRERSDVDNGSRWKEYRLSGVGPFGAGPGFAVEMRYVRSVF